MLDVKKIKVIIKLSLCAIMIVSFAFSALPAIAAAVCGDGICDTGEATSCPSDCDGDMFGVGVVGEATGLGKKDLRETVGSIINVALGFLGVVAVVIILIGGFKYMTAGGSDEKVGEAKKWIISGIIGLAIILSAYAITSFVIERLVTATGVVE